MRYVKIVTALGIVSGGLTLAYRKVLATFDNLNFHIETL